MQLSYLFAALKIPISLQGILRLSNTLIFNSILPFQYFNRLLLILDTLFNIWNLIMQGSQRRVHNGSMYVSLPKDPYARIKCKV